MLRLFLFQFLKQLIHRIFKFFIILPCFGRIDKFKQRGKILFLLRGLIIDVADQSTIQKSLCFHPKILRRFLPFVE